MKRRSLAKAQLLICRAAAWGALSGLIAGCTAHALQSERLAAPLNIFKQGSFFIGGTARQSEALSGVLAAPKFIQAGTVMTGQMYVQYQIPVKVSRLPVIMIHGGGLSGQAYETTPDGRMGWAEYFVRSGRPVYVADQIGRGRSGFDAIDYNAVRLGKISPQEQGSITIIGREYAWTWFRIGPKWGTPFQDTQFPVDAIDAFYSMWIPDLSGSLPSPNPNYSALAALGRKVGGAVLMGHSQSFMFPQHAALVDSGAVKGIISLESGYACATSFTPQEREVLAKIPMLIVFADHLADVPEPMGSQWVTSMAKCREFATSIRQTGGDVTFLHLPEIGIRGNTHMFMLDKNSMQIADYLLNWIDRHVERL